VRGDVAEEAQDPRLVAPLLLPVREVDGAPGDRDRIILVAGYEMRLGLAPVWWTPYRERGGAPEGSPQ